MQRQRTRSTELWIDFAVADFGRAISCRFLLAMFDFYFVPTCREGHKRFHCEVDLRRGLFGAISECSVRVLVISGAIRMKYSCTL